MIYYQNLVDYAAAIYHFRKFLQFRPNDAHADTVRQFINVSVQELARSASLGPVSIEVQKQLNRLADENWKLKQQVDQLQKALTGATNRTASPSAALPGPTNQLVPADATAAPSVEKPAPKSAPLSAAPAKNGTKSKTAPAQTKIRNEESTVAAKSPGGRTHVVRANESAEGIARRYGIRFSSLLVANPQLDPKRMKPGQVLKIPTS
ncbi:MAG: LysM peptidoglycan-binding domain-containing protein [Verrucomicrobia bacterium]|nr:LysM peptidoglycan-binding domain-containing protein [Verrucomicrobiota bacterium]